MTLRASFPVLDPFEKNAQEFISYFVNKLVQYDARIAVDSSCRLAYTDIREVKTHAQ